MNDTLILIAEDDADDRFLLQTAFKEKGLTDTLHFVENGIEALEYLHNITSTDQSTQAYPTFILLDLNMPKKSGREVLKEIKQNPQFHHIPVIVFSTTYNEQEKYRCIELGANDYITKPNNFETLLDIVARLHNSWTTNDNHTR